MKQHNFCTAAGSDDFAGLINFISDALYGYTGPGLQRLADDNLKMLVQGGKWAGVWSQNYFGMCCTTPLLTGKLLDYHLHNYELFFELQGDGKRADDHGYVAPEGALAEYISLAKGTPMPRYKNDEGCGLADEFDFWVEGCAASVISTVDCLLAKRDKEKAVALLPKIRKSVAFLLSRRDEKTGLLKVGPAGILIERAYGATFRSKGVADYGLPAGAAVNTVQALRLTAELELFAGCSEQAASYRAAADELAEAVKVLIENNEYLINYLDADGVRHGVQGAEKYGYVEGNANLDGAAWGVLPPEVAVKALAKVGEVSPTPLAVSVYPTHDDAHYSYQNDNDPAYGGIGCHWNGSTWYSSQARYIYGLLRYNCFDAAYAAADTMRNIYQSGMMRDMMDDYGKSVQGDYTPEAAGTYYIDGFGALGGWLRGIFEVRYGADTVALSPHLPENMSSYVQNLPYYWGNKELYLKVTGTGSTVTGLKVNGQELSAALNGNLAVIKFDDLPEKAEIEFIRA